MVTDKQEPHNFLLKFVSKTINAYEIEPEAKLVHQGVRAFIRWVFDFLRNSMIASLLFYFAIKSNNSTLYTISQGAFLLLGVYLWSYLDFWLLRPFYRMTNQRVTIWLNILFHAVGITALSLLSLYVLSKIVLAIAEGYFRS